MYKKEFCIIHKKKINKSTISNNNTNDSIYFYIRIIFNKYFNRHFSLMNKHLYIKNISIIT